MIFPVNVVNHINPAYSVIIADGGGVNGVTYGQLKNSLGQQVYLVESLYIYSPTFRQLIGTIKYSRYDVSGSQDITNIATTVDPYQDANAISLSLEKTATPIILNGNSYASFKLLPNTFLQIKFISKRITNSFGMNLFNFKSMEDITKTKFFENYGSSIADIIDTNKHIKENHISNSDGITTPAAPAAVTMNDNIPLAFVSLAVITSLLYVFSKNK